MSLTHSAEFECPYCMVINDIDIDEVYDIDQTQIVDCQICCQPIEITIRRDEDAFVIDARQENE